MRGGGGGDDDDDDEALVELRRACRDYTRAREVD